MRSSVAVFALLLSFFTHFAAVASCNDTLLSSPVNFVLVTEPAPPQASLSDHFHGLMNSSLLLQQSDFRLEKRDLLVPNGGLCGPTCGANVISAIRSFHRNRRVLTNFTRHADYLVYRIVENTRKVFRTDARIGIELFELELGLDSLAVELGIRLNMGRLLPSPDRPIVLSDLVPADNELLIISVQNGVYQGTALYHALVVTKSNIYTRTLNYSNPNFPNQIMRTTIQSHFDEDGNLTVKLAVDPDNDTSVADSYTGTVSEILRVRVD